MIKAKDFVVIKNIQPPDADKLNGEVGRVTGLRRFKDPKKDVFYVYIRQGWTVSLNDHEIEKITKESDPEFFI